MKEKDETKYQAMIETVAELLQTVGIQGISMAKVAQQVGISKSNIYIYFDNKDDLLKQVFLAKKAAYGHYLTQQIKASHPKTIREQVDIYLRAIYQFTVDHPTDMATIISFVSSPDINVAELAPHDLELDFLQMDQLMQDGISTHQLRQMADPTPMMQLAFDAITKYAIAVRQSRINPVQVPLEQIISMVWAAVRNPTDK